jgi:FkbM family methyltransferase
MKLENVSTSLRYPLAAEMFRSPAASFRKFRNFHKSHISSGLWEISTIPSVEGRNATFYLFLRFIAKLILFPLVPERRISDENILGSTMRVLDYRTFLGLISEIFFHRIYYFASSSASPLILDAGSNIGMSILFFKWLYPKSRVIGFEPDPQTFEVLQFNVRRNRFDNVELHNKALHSTPGEIDFYMDPDRAGSGKMSTVKERFTGPSARPVRSLKVEAVRLSPFIQEEVDLLKMDIEGAEVSVIQELADAGKLRLIKEMFVEYHHHLKSDEDHLSRMLRPLEENGFGYQISAPAAPQWARKSVQPILIYAYRHV